MIKKCLAKMTFHQDNYNDLQYMYIICDLIYNYSMLTRKAK